MKQIFLLLALCILAYNPTLAQQTGTLSGKIVDKESAVPGTTVLIEGTNLGAVANVDGEFTIKQIPAGNHTVQIQSLGFQSTSKTITIIAGENTHFDLTLLRDNLNLNTVVVSGTRYELDRKESPVIVSVITPKLFSATQSMVLSEGLDYLPGVRVETNCQNCGFTQVRLNGLQGAYSQILINSRPVFSALNSVYGLDQIPANIIDRVEVVRSGGSALYGSNAIAGTINIITKEPVDNTWQIGSNFASIDGETPDNTINFNGSLVSEDLSNGVTFYGMTRDRESYDANGDGFTEITKLQNNTFGMKAFLKPGSQSKITLDFNAINEYRSGGDKLNLAPHYTDITEELDHTTTFAGLTYDWFSKDFKNKVSVYFSGQKTQRESYYGGLGGERTAADSASAANAYGDTDDQAYVLGAQYTRYFGSNVLVVGVENQGSKTDDQIAGYNRVVDQSVNSLGFYGQFEWKISPRLKTLIGARYDNSIVDGLYEIGTISRSSDVNVGALSPRFTLMYDITKTLQFRGGYARGFRAPQAFNEDLHIASVGGEPSFVILSEDLVKELSDAFTASFNFTKNFGDTQMNLLVEGFYTDLKNPFTIVSTGSVLPNGSILEETRNGSGAFVSGMNFELSVSPSSKLTFQLGGTVQTSEYKTEQILFEPEEPNEAEPTVVTNEFTRSPNNYGFLTAGWSGLGNLDINLTGTYTGTMIVPHVVSESGYMDLENSDAFMDVNLKLGYHFDISDSFHLELSAGVQNIFNSYQDDFDEGPTRDSVYIYGPAGPRTYFVGIKIGDFH